MIFQWDQTLEKYVPVTMIVSLVQTKKMINGEISWETGEGYYYVVKGEVEGYYPLPLIYAGAEERQRSAMENGVSPPSEDYIKRVRKKVRDYFWEGGMNPPTKRKKWKISYEHFKRLAALNDPFEGLDFDFNECDDIIAEILRKRGTEVLFDIVEEYGFGLFYTQPVFSITFEAKDIVGWNDYDSSYEKQVYKFAAYCCAKRAEETKEDVGVSEYGIIEDFIDELRARLAQVEDACDNIE